METSVYEQRFPVWFTYPVCFTRNAWATDNTILIDRMSREIDSEPPHKTLVVIDQGVALTNPLLAASIENYCRVHRKTIRLAAEPIYVPGGEAAKQTDETFYRVLDIAEERRLCRKSFIIAIGGGSVLDAVGLAAALIHRGCHLIRMPSTTLAQCDAGVGVKNGLNGASSKNFIGTFAPPFAVINDSTLLETQRQEDWIGGLAEAFKVAVIKDAAFFAWLVENTGRLVARDLDAMEEAVRRTAILHLDHIRTAGDPFETGSARPLDFGHWAAHRLETLSEFSLRHGQAVAIGIAIDATYARLTGRLTAEACTAIVTALEACGLPVCHPLLEQPDNLLKGINQFREHLGGRLCVTLPKGIGSREEVNTLDLLLIRKAVEELLNRS